MRRAVLRVPVPRPLEEDPDGKARLARDTVSGVIIKAAAGGGGRGMRVVNSEAALSKRS